MVIGYVETALRSRILVPQATVTDPDLRAVVDPDAAPIDTYGAELDVLKATTTPIGRMIGGGGILRHTLLVELSVADGDVARGMTRRDGIVTDLVLRLEADRLRGVVSPDGRQELTGQIGWSVDYGATEVDGGALQAFARWTITVDADLSPT